MMRILLLTIIYFGVLFSASAVSAASTEFLIGSASRVINPEIGSWVQGAGVPKVASEIRDDLEANGLYISNGEVEILMVSCDLAGIEPDLAVRLREAMGVAAGIMPRDILITCTHTHGGPSLLKTNYLMPLDTQYMLRLEEWLTDLAVETVESAQPGKLGWAKGALHIGYNRRLTWQDGTHTMHGNAGRADFAGLEGPDDPQHLALFAKDLKGKMLAVLYHNTSHPTIFYGAGVYSADFPGEVRAAMRANFDEDLAVLYLNGAQGDISNQNYLDPIKESKDEALARISELVINKNMELYDQVTWINTPILKHGYEDLKVGVRLPSPESLAGGRTILKRIDEGENIRGRSMIMAFGAVHLQEKFGESPFDILPIHALRIGDLALVTQPCELYCQFGLDIKLRSPGVSTIVVGLTDGYNGYCPTIYGLLGGGYSGAPISWTRLEPNAGYKIVETATQLLSKIW